MDHLTIDLSSWNEWRVGGEMTNMAARRTTVNTTRLSTAWFVLVRDTRSISKIAFRLSSTLESENIKLWGVNIKSYEVYSVVYVTTMQTEG